jgi:type VI secretion system lysozyme-like protein
MDIQGLRPSIIDRLADPDSRGTAARQGYSVDQMEKAIGDDLERLLNTRSDDDPALEPYPRYAKVAGYGLPDLGVLTRLHGADPQQLCSIIEQRLRYYEPRLNEIQVTLLESNDPLRIRLQLRAALAVDPWPELVFDRTLDLSSGYVASQ